VQHTKEFLPVMLTAGEDKASMVGERFQ